MVSPPVELPADLAELARAYGIATEFWDWRGQPVTVAAASVSAVLTALGIDPTQPAAALAAKDDAAWQRMVPACVVVRDDQSAPVPVHVAHGAPARAWIELESGEIGADLRQVDNWNPPRAVGGRLVGEASFEVPAGLPLGYHRLHAQSGDETSAGALIVTPARLSMPPGLGAGRAWGLATQLYSVRSRRSWGVGDLGDLGDLAPWAAVAHGAGYVLINPLHAAAPVAPMEPSPYLP